MRTCVIASLSVVLAFGSACRTSRETDVHTVLDIRHVQEGAGGVLDFIEGKTSLPPSLERGGASGGQHGPANQHRSSKGTDLMLRMQARYPAIQVLKDKRCLGEDNRGYLELRSSEGLSGDEKNEAQKLVHAENTDRKAFYKEIVRLEDNEEITLSKVEQVYATERLNRAKPGDPVQLPPAGESFNQFKDSPAGKRLGEECKPEAWVKWK